jgi:hypothetical protein
MRLLNNLDATAWYTGLPVLEVLDLATAGGALTHWPPGALDRVRDLAARLVHPRNVP